MNVFDVAVIGTGLGGSANAAALIEKGFDVCILESGGFASGPLHDALGKRIIGKMMRKKQKPGRWPGRMLVQLDGGEVRQFPTMIGYGAGGSGIVYGAALSRMRRADFEHDESSALPGGAAGNALPSDWPVRADEMFESYDRAEKLLKVVGSRDPLSGDVFAELPPAPVSARDARIMAHLRSRGAHPYRIPVAISYPSGQADEKARLSEVTARNNTWNCALDAAIPAGELRMNAHVTSIESAAQGFRIKVAGQEDVLARRLVVSAGALNSPRILLASPDLFSGRIPDMVGRGLMFHKSDFFFTTVGSEASPTGPRKTIALRDAYSLPEGAGGEIQSLPVRPSLSSIKGATAAADDVRCAAYASARKAARYAVAAGIRLGNITAFATILEDFPYDGNRVLPSDGDMAGDIRMIYSQPKELHIRQDALRAATRDLFGAEHVEFLAHGDEQMNWGHACGTCRMGNDPAISVTDAKGRLHGVPGVYVADASVFASSSGANPGLTVVAQALRVADAVAMDAQPAMLVMAV